MARLGYYIIHGLMRALGALPLRFHLACGKALGFLAGSVLRYRRDVVDVNLARSFPDKKYDTLAQIRKDYYRYLGTVFAEAVWFCGCNGAKGGERLRKADIVRIEDPEALNQLYRDSDSIVLMSAHSGNWELYGGFMYYFGDTVPAFGENDVHVVYKRLSSRVWDEVMRVNRTMPIADKEAYEGLVESQQVMRHILKYRGEKKLYIFITDQSPYQGSNAVDVGEFLHQPTRSMDGAAKIALRQGFALAYLSFLPDRKPGCWTLRIRPICTEPGTMTTQEIMKTYYQLLQEDIEAVPWNYLWTHKRWKA